MRSRDAIYWQQRAEQAETEINRLRTHIATMVTERETERRWYNNAIAVQLAEIKRLRASQEGK
jgi:hypothetical protein